MPAKEKHLDRELLTITRMVEIYCAAHHGNSDCMLCEDCSEFLNYAAARLKKCPIHCYKPERKAQARIIMRYSGPRMLLHHPMLVIAHKLDGVRKAIHPRELARADRLSSRKK